MITFKAFLLEAEKRTKAIDLEEAFKLIDQHCTGFAKSMSHQTLFRGGSGTSGDEAYLGDSNLGEPRKSANTSNWFTLWHDNNPRWAKFPKRSRSFICSSDSFTAEAYGDTHIVVPYDNAHVGIVPESDLFGAIGGPDHGDLSEFNTVITAVLRVVSEKNGNPMPDNYRDMVTGLKAATRAVLEQKPDDHIDTALEFMKHFRASNYYDVVAECFVPDGFKEGPASSIKLPDDKEVYVQGKVVLLPWSFRKTEQDKYEQNGYKDMIDKASEKYNWNLFR